MAELCVRTEPLVRCRTVAEPSIRAGRNRESSGSPEPLGQLCLSRFRSLSWEECEDARPLDPLTSTPFIAVLVHSIVAVILLSFFRSSLAQKGPRARAHAGALSAC